MAKKAASALERLMRQASRRSAMQSRKKVTTRSFWVLLLSNMPMGRVTAASRASATPRREAPSRPAMRPTRRDRAGAGQPLQEIEQPVPAAEQPQGQQQHLGEAGKIELALDMGPVEFEGAVLDPMLDARQMIGLGIPIVRRADQSEQQRDAADEQDHAGENPFLEDQPRGESAEAGRQRRRAGRPAPKDRQRQDSDGDAPSR